MHRTAWTSKEWEQKVIVERDGIHLSPSERPTVLRERHGTSQYDEYGDVKTSEVETKGGVYQRVETEYFDADTKKWLIALARRSCVISAKSKAGPLPDSRITEYR